MATGHLYEGQTMPWTNATGSDVASGDLVLVSNLACIALGDIANGAAGLLAIEEVWAQVAAPDEDIVQGSRIYNAAAHNLASQDVAGAAAWVAATAYALGDYALKTTTNGHAYKCVVAGTSHATTEPTWPTGGTTVTDGTVTWLDMGTVQDIGIAFNGQTGITATTWAVATAYSLNDLVLPTDPNGHYYKCTTAGTSHATTEPTWPTNGTTVTDGTAVFTDMGVRKVKVKLNA